MNIRSLFLVLAVAFFLPGCSGGSSNIKEEQADANLKLASMTNIQLGVGYIKRGQYEVAQEKLIKAIEQDSNNVDAYTTMAFLMMQIDEMEKAEYYYLEALDIKSNDPELRNGYGTYLCRLGRINDALTQFESAYSNPFYKSAFLAYANAGTCLLQQKRYKQSEKFLRKALKLQPELSGALISMAELSVKSKNYLKARAYIQRYHAINKPSAESLWIQVKAERARGAKEHYYKYAKQILDDFPDSRQAVMVRELDRRDRTK